MKTARAVFMSVFLRRHRLIGSSRDNRFAPSHIRSGARIQFSFSDNHVKGAPRNTPDSRTSLTVFYE